MRVLLLLRGSAGCGKSTWIEKNALKPYTLSADDIRMMCSSPVLSASGVPYINPSNDSVVWGILFKILETRMQNGEFTVIDATNSKTSDMNRYKELCDQYKYRTYCVDFTGIPIDVVKERNRGREPLKQVPDEAIEKMHSRFATQKIPSGITVIQPDELERIWFKKIDLSAYNKVHVIGDIHGCFTALKEYFDADGWLKDDEFYIFLGDYIDRGIENVEVIRFLLSIYQLKNVLLLEGNHERWLWVWANNGVSKSKEFEIATRSQFEESGLDKKEVRKLFRTFGQCAYFDYRGNTYLVTHGGLSGVPENFTFISTMQMLKGCGTYEEVEIAENAFVENTPSNFYQIHGHRNTKGLPVFSNSRNFNLEGRVEFGGYLRAVQLLPDGGQCCVEIQNTVFKSPEEMLPKNEHHKASEKTVADIIMDMRQNRFIQEKRYGNISSFNFTKQAFYDKVWDNQTMTARGLFINIPKQKIVARSYDKFFNINERPETKLAILQNRFSFPITAYVKENGFLGIVSYNEEDDSLFVSSKSAPDGPFSEWLRGNIESMVSRESIDGMKRYAKDNNVSFVFECVDMVHDPHIIEYPESRLYLLDIIYNEIPCRKYSFERTCEVADMFGLRHKERAIAIETWQEFYDWYYMVLDEDYLYSGRHIEGFVIEDANGFMVKLKLAYYNFWKFMRGIAHECIKKGYIDGRRTSALTTPIANQFYGWAKTLHDLPDRETLPHDICTLRKMFFETDTGKQFIAEQ